MYKGTKQAETIVSNFHSIAEGEPGSRVVLVFFSDTVGITKTLKSNKLIIDINAVQDGRETLSLEKNIISVLGKAITKAVTVR